MASAVLADWDEQNQLKELTYPEIDSALEVLRNGPRRPEKCDLDKKYSCSFNSYCSSLKQRDRNIYIYENEEGHRLPNTALLAVYIVLARCARGESFPTLTDDPFMHPEKFAEPKNQKLFQKGKARINGIFLESQQRVIKVLMARKNGTNDAAIESMIQRIRTVTLEVPDGKDFGQLVSKGCEVPNAAYRYDHKVVICPQLGNFPEASIMSVVAHELAHAIDPCCGALDLVKTKTGYEVNMDFNPVSLMSVSEKKSSVAVPGILADKNPFSSVISCLQTSDSVGIKAPTVTQLQESYFKEAAGDGQSGFYKFAQKIPELYPKYGMCENFSGDGRVGEAFADWIGAQVIAKKIEEIPESTRAKRFAFESQGVFLASHCPQALAAVQERASSAMMGGQRSCGEAFADIDYSNQTNKNHPSTGSRITKILLAQPEIQKALGCRPEKFKACQ